MKNLFKEATFWELSNVLWWASIILISVPGLVWYKLIKKLYYYIKNTYFLKFIISRKSDEWCKDVVKNYEKLCTDVKYMENLKNKHPMHYKCYTYCKNRLNENSK